jgi:hypothetical protein
MKKRILLFFCTILLYNTSFSQKLFPKQALLNDIDSLYVMVNDVHPNMFANIPMANFEKELGMIKQQVRDSMSRLGFYTVVAPLLEKIGDGHTSLVFPTNELQNPVVKLFPFSVRIRFNDSATIIRTDHSLIDNGIPSGAEIVSINGKKTDSLVGKMFCFLSGEKLFFKAAYLEYMFTPLLYALTHDSVFSLVYIDNHKTILKTVNGIPYSQRFKEQTPTEETPIDYSLSLDTAKMIACIHFNNFSNPSVFKNFIDSAFSVIEGRKIRDVIIDIRQNSGGNSGIGDEFFQYISPVPFNQYGKVIVKISPRLIRLFGGSMDDMKDSIGFKIFDNDTLIGLRPNKLRYSGHLYLLTSNYTFSSATDFAWTFKYLKMGIIVGEETGGLVVCFGDKIRQSLPNTKIGLDVSYKKFYCYGASDDDTHGVIPDYNVSSAKAMEYAVDMILKGRGSAR